MATYLLLSRLTDEGRKTLKERPERLQEVNREVESLGGRVTDQFAVFGPHDFINVVEAPDNETVTNISVELSSRGTLRIVTMAAERVALPRRLPHLGGAKDATFAVFTKLTPQGREGIQTNPARLSEVDAQVERLGATITHQFRVLGEHDFVTIARAPDNETAARIVMEIAALGTVRLTTYPAIRIERFVELLKLQPYRTEPHRWQTSLWAKQVRRVARPYVMLRHVRHFCQPLEIEGMEKVRSFRGPALIIANHTSHFDTPAVLNVLPPSLRERTAVAAAADRFYRANMRTWWFSLFWNTFPIQRGGGKAALDYPMWLLKHGWSILIFPEGGRFKPGQVKRFHHGPAIMAMMAKVPVVPVYMEGLDKIMPKGQRSPTPGPVNVRIGAPITLEGIESVPEGTARLEEAMRELANGNGRV
ncbi:MAG: GYD domain-containing protein [Dehalococcoidia bacterium]